MIAVHRALAVLAPLSLGVLACGGADAPPATPASAGAASAGSAAPPTSPPSAPTAAAPVARPAWASEYPPSRTVDVKETIFGAEVRDPYRWLEDAKSPEVQAWMKAQNDFAHAKLAAAPERAALAARLKELAYVDTQTAPMLRGGHLFYSRRSGMQEKAVWYWRPGKRGAEKVLLDPNTWSTDGSKALHSTSVSWDGRYVAYGLSENNSDDATLHVLEVSTGKLSTVDVIPGARYAHASWTPKSDGFYYTRVPVDPKIPADELPGHAAVYFHALGSDPAKDVLVHEKTGDPSRFVHSDVSKDGRFLFVMVSYGWSRNDIWFRDLQKTPHAAEWTPLAVGNDALYDVSAYKGRFFVRTNEGASKYRVFVVDPAHPQRDAWKEIVPERQDATLASADVLGGQLALSYLKDVASRLELRSLDGKALREIALPGLGSAQLTGEPDQDEAYWTFESYTSPSEIHATSIQKGGDALWFKVKVPADLSAYAVDQVFFPSKDGTRIPMFIVHAKGMAQDGSAPAMMTGYGGFNSSETPEFAKSIVPWIERGGIFVFTNLRGGGEYGEQWHRAGMRHEKQHVFDDFEAAAEYLAREKWTRADRLAITGGSNGGLLVGAAMTQRPDLFRVVLCGVPLLDMVRYEGFGAGATWSEEYGKAAEEADFRVLFAYSPYHHVTPGVAYPSVLFESADSDDCVDPMHARKLAAQLQAASSGGPVLLRIEHNSGHGGSDLVHAWVERMADRYAFTFAELKKVGAVMAK